MTCPAGAITSFPLGISITPSQNQYDALADPALSGMTIQWGTKTTAPTFSNTNSTGGILNEDDSTTLRYQGVRYSLSRAQICAQTHSGWILPVGANNKEDLILIFTNNNDSVTLSNIMMIVPIIRGNVVTDPAYLKGLADPTITGSFSLKDCVPSNSYLHYVSCLAGYVSNANVSNVAVFVNITGITVNDTLMTSIITNSGFGTAFPTIQAPFLTSFRGSKTIGVGDNTLEKYITTSTNDEPPAAIEGFGLMTDPADAAKRTDSTDKYKCVPLNPDADVVNGAIQVNTETGELLTKVLSARKGVMTADTAPGAFDPGKIEEGVSIALGIIFGILFLSIGGYFMKQYLFPSPVTASGASGPASGGWFTYVKAGGVFLFIVGVIVLIGWAGYAIGTAVNKSKDS